MKRVRRMEEKFNQLKDQWLENTKFSSNSNLIVSDPNYLEIISMGTEAIPFILKDWETSDNHWFVALRKITDVDLISIHSRNSGKIRKMKQDWITYLNSKQNVDL